MIKLRSLLQEKDVKYVYHGTLAKHLPNIVAYGLKPSTETNWGGDLGKFSEGKIFVTDFFPNAVYYGNAGFWKSEHPNTFKPVLRFRFDVDKMIKDPKSSYDYYVEHVVKAPFEIFVPDESTEDGESDVSYNEMHGTWRRLTPQIADAIAHGEWDGEIIDDD